mmetsp:Transcript_86200/g.244546  ORF Transcript_86200/g.244546 Transcript_86200/m.244546 type:complete len:257 (-) Transcript_86200:183-953(-)
MSMKWSALPSWCVVTTGVGMTPSWRAHPSPMVRDTARPGLRQAPSSQTRAGPTGLPSSKSGATVPPLSSIRSRSSSMSGLQSCVNATPSQFGTFASGEFWPSTARESPTFATWSVRRTWSSSTATPVVPLYSTSCARWLNTSSSTFVKAASRALFGFFMTLSCAARWPGSRCATSEETSWPKRPWPSKTPKRRGASPLPSSSPTGQHTTVESWFCHPGTLSFGSEATSTRTVPRISSESCSHLLYGGSDPRGLGSL